MPGGGRPRQCPRPAPLKSQARPALPRKEQHRRCVDDLGEAPGRLRHRVHTVRGRARESFSIADASRRASACQAEGASGCQGAAFLDGKAAERQVWCPPWVIESRKGPSGSLRSAARSCGPVAACCSGAGATGGVRGSPNRPRRGRTSRRRGSLLAASRGKPAVRAVEGLRPTEELLIGASRAAAFVREEAARGVSQSGRSAVKRLSLLRGTRGGSRTVRIECSHGRSIVADNRRAASFPSDGWTPRGARPAGGIAQ